MSADLAAYRLLLRLYPRAFREEFSGDLVQMFGDLTRRDGRTRAWLRCVVDTAVSVPRLRLEAVMQPPAVPPALALCCLTIAAAGVATLGLGAAVGLPLLLVAAVIALSQRTRLARALAAAPPARQHRLRLAALLAAGFVATAASWMVQVRGGGDLSNANVLAHNVLGLTFLAGALGCLAASLTAPAAPGASDTGRGAPSTSR